MSEQARASICAIARFVSVRIALLPMRRERERVKVPQYLSLINCILTWYKFNVILNGLHAFVSIIPSTIFSWFIFHFVLCLYLYFHFLRRLCALLHQDPSEKKKVAVRWTFLQNWHYCSCRAKFRLSSKPFVSM